MRLSASTVMLNTLPFEQACAQIASLGFVAIDSGPGEFRCPHLTEIVQRLGPDGLKGILAENNVEPCAITRYTVGCPRYAELPSSTGGGVNSNRTQIHGEKGGLHSRFAQNPGLPVVSGEGSNAPNRTTVDLTIEVEERKAALYRHANWVQCI